MLLLDVKAAFDSVWHEGLIYKMIRMNFPTEIIKIIQCFLKDRTFQVHIGSQSSRIFEVPAGCPQGSCLSPILYNIYTADFPNLDYCTMSVFADDTAIICSGNLAQEIINKLQRALTEVTLYFNRWKIMLNASKSQAIYFTRKRKECFIPQNNFNVQGMSIQWDNTVKYLGVILDPKLKFKEHVAYIINKINVLTRILYPFINRNSKINIVNKKLIVKSIFHAVMFYAAPAWACIAKCHIKKLQVSQNKLLKLIFNLPWFFSTTRLHTLAGIELVDCKLERLLQNFKRRCTYSDFIHINELASI